MTGRPGWKIQRALSREGSPVEIVSPKMCDAVDEISCRLLILVALTGIEPESRRPIWSDVVVSGRFHVEAGWPFPDDSSYGSLRCDQCVIKETAVIALEYGERTALLSRLISTSDTRSVFRRRWRYSALGSRRFLAQTI